MRWYWRLAISMAVAGWLTFLLMFLLSAKEPLSGDALVRLAVAPFVMPCILPGMLLAVLVGRDPVHTACCSVYFATFGICYAVLSPSRLK